MINKNLKIQILIFLASGVWLLAFSSVFAAVVSFSTTDVSVESGQNFILNVSVNPEAAKIYTLKMELKYPADLLKIKSFKPNSDWMPLVQPGYDLIDNISGLLIKTGGYPAGLSEKKTFGAIFFQAKKSGQGIVQLSDNSLILNESNQNVLSGTPQVSVDVKESLLSEAKETITRPSAGEEVVSLEQEQGKEESKAIKSPEKQLSDIQPPVLISHLKFQPFNLLASIKTLFTKEIKVPIYDILLLLAVILVIYLRYRRKS